MSRLWYYAKNDQQLGPVSDTDFQQMARVGALQPADLVWCDGMANWLPARDITGLFPTAPAPAPQSPPAPFQLQQPPPEQHPLNETPRRDSYERDWDDRPVRRRRRRRKKGGTGIGAVIGILAGVFVVVGLIGGCIFLGFYFMSGNDDGTRSWSLQTNEKATYYIHFKKGHRVELEVKSRGNSDVDLFVFDGPREIGRDIDINKNCFVSFVPRTSKRYKVEVWNRLLIDMPWRNGHNTGTLYFRQISPDN